MNHYVVSMFEHPCESAIDAWTRLLGAHQAALGSVEAALKAAGLPPLAWYDVLVELERADGCGMRPFELEERLRLPQYGLSRLIARLEEAGLVERHSCTTDRRGQFIAATEAGRVMRRRMAPVYAAAVQQAVGARLPAGEAERLADLLGRLIAPPA
jgi:DNA-binding MarR family transcriptional regulator